MAKKSLFEKLGLVEGVAASEYDYFLLGTL